MTRAETSDEAKNLLASLASGDEVRFGDDKWRVIDVRENDRGTPFVEFKALTGYHPGTTTLKPSSGFRNSCVVSHGRGMGSHYSSLELTG